MSSTPGKGSNPPVLPPRRVYQGTLMLVLVMMSSLGLSGLYIRCSSTAGKLAITLSVGSHVHKPTSKLEGLVTNKSQNLTKPGLEEVRTIAAGDGAVEQAAAAAQPTVPTVVQDLSNRTEHVLPDIAQLVLEADKQHQGQRVIAMSLYGTDRRYVENAVANAMLARRDWHGWTLRVYYGQGVPGKILEILKVFGTELIQVNKTFETGNGMFWRFLAATDPTVSRFIIRDSDAHLSRRDKAAVDEWVDSGMFFHTLHDSIHHDKDPILGGLWGAIGGFINPSLVLSGVQSVTNTAWGVDQSWLAKDLWPHVKKYTLDHSSYHCGKWNAAKQRAFPTQREGPQDFVGNVYRLPHFRGDATADAICPERCRKEPSWVHC